MILPNFPSDIVVNDLLSGHQAGTMSFEVTWKSMDGVSGYNVYRNHVPYGTFEQINTDAITNNFFVDSNTDFIYDTDTYYRVSAINKNGEGELSEPQTNSNTIEYQNRIGGYWNDSYAFVNNPHTDVFPTGRKEKSYQSVNPLPSNVLRRYQFNKIIRDELWLLQDVGEKVFLIKRSQNNFNNSKNIQEFRRSYAREDNPDIIEYYEPIVIMIRFVDAEETKQYQTQGIVTRKAPRSWTIFTPTIKNKDIIINNRNERFEVVNLTMHRFRGAVTHQDFDLIKLESTDPVYENSELDVSGRINELL